MILETVASLKNASVLWNSIVLLLTSSYEDFSGYVTCLNLFRRTNVFRKDYIISLCKLSCFVLEFSDCF